MKKVKKIEDSALWREAVSISQAVYALLPELPDDEHLGMQIKMRQRAFDATDDVAQALGDVDPRNVKWHLSNARRDFFSLKNGLAMAYKARYIEPKPELMLKIDKAVESIDSLMDEAAQAIPAWFAEMQPAVKGRHE